MFAPRTTGPPCPRCSRRHHSRNPLQILSDSHVVPSRQQLPHALCDGAADFHYQPALRLQRFAGLRNEAFDHFQACVAGEDRVARLMFADFELYLVCFRFAHIRRIRNHEIESSGLKPLQQVGVMEVDPDLELMAGRIGTRDFESCR